MATTFKALRSYYFVAPFAALILLVLSWGQILGWPALLGVAAVLTVTVFVAVHHAEVVALKVGEPFGSLLLAVAVTVIEVGMIVILMIDNPGKTQDLARDTVFSAIMISTNAIIGGSLLIKTLKQRVANFNSEGVVGALAALASLTVMSLVLPTVTVSSPGPTFTPAQLWFSALTSLVIYLTFVTVQTVRHRDYFLPPVRQEQTLAELDHVEAPSSRQAWFSMLALLVSLASVVGLAKVASPLVQGVVDDLGFPQMVVAVTIAMVVLLPETISALNAARFGRTQTSLNLGLGSSLASIGLTIPVIAVMSTVFGFQVNLGLDSTEMVFLLLTLLVTALTLIPGRATLLQGVLHLCVFGTYLMVVFLP